MAHNQTNLYDFDPHIAELYDQQETDADDIALIRKLVRDFGPLRILELFCGTGRILIPLAQDGHRVVGLDQAEGMLERAREKICLLPSEVQRRIRLRRSDVVTDTWPSGFDLVILGGNCFYELATPQEQENCVISAASSLVAGGHIYLDNDHMEGGLDESWREASIRQSFPTGICADGTRVESTSETIWWDVERRLIRMRRATKVTLVDGRILARSYVQQKHPVSAVEVRGWLEGHGFVIDRCFGDQSGGTYTDASSRAVFWARKA